MRYIKEIKHFFTDNLSQHYPFTYKELEDILLSLEDMGCRIDINAYACTKDSDLFGTAFPISVTDYITKFPIIQIEVRGPFPYDHGYDEVKNEIMDIKHRIENQWGNYKKIDCLYFCSGRTGNHTLVMVEYPYKNYFKYSTKYLIN